MARTDNEGGEMRVLLQRVTTARVAVASETVGRIDAGMLVLVGVGRDDDETTARRLAERVAGYRMFGDADGKTKVQLYLLRSQKLMNFCSKCEISVDF